MSIGPLFDAGFAAGQDAAKAEIERMRMASLQLRDALDRTTMDRNAARAEIERLRAALRDARQSMMGHISDCGDHCEDAVAKIDAALGPIDQQNTVDPK